MEATPVQIGDSIIYVDAVGKEHSALVTNVWGRFDPMTEAEADELISKWHGQNDPEAVVSYKATLMDVPTTVPSLNLVFVTDDETQTDPYGRQIARNTSVCHKSAQAAHGMYWKNVD